MVSSQILVGPNLKFVIPILYDYFNLKIFLAIFCFCNETWYIFLDSSRILQSFDFLYDIGLF